MDYEIALIPNGIFASKLELKWFCFFSELLGVFRIYNCKHQIKPLTETQRQLVDYQQYESFKLFDQIQKSGSTIEEVQHV